MSPISISTEDRWDDQDLIHTLLQSKHTGILRGYSLVRKLRPGAMGETFLLKKGADHIVVKIPIDGVANHAEFCREMRNMSVLRHKHIVEYKGSDNVQGILYVAMEYCEGGDLQAMIDPLNPVPPAQATAMICDVLDALDYLHSAEVDVDLPGSLTKTFRGIVHRDIKPSNILLASGVYKVADFGLSKAFEAAGMSGMTQTGATKGTFKYMPRQQVLDSKRATPEVDVWAAAACLYALLTGVAPRDFSDTVTPAFTVLRTSVIPVSDRGVSIPDDLARILNTALNDEGPLKYQRASELCSDLRQLGLGSS